MGSNRKGKFNLNQFVALPQPEHYPETPVRFSFAYCGIGDKYCIKKLHDQELERLYKTFGKLEKYTWGQFQFLPRDKSLTMERSGSSSFELLKGRYPLFDEFCHFRVDGTGTGIFRVFAAKQHNLIYVLLLDSQGAIHHS